MREFFRQELKSLELKTGYKQYERLLEREGWQKDLNELLDILVRVCDQFPYIPDKDKESIIQNNLVSDGEFTGFNARIVFKWLSQAKSKYFKELAHTETSGGYDEKPALTGVERDAKIQEWLASLGEGFQEVPKLTQAEIIQTGQADPPKPVYFRDPVLIEEHKKKVQQAREKTIRERHPEYNDEQVKEALAQLPDPV